MIAVNQIRPLPHYRREAFDAGLKACGYSLRTSGTPQSRADLLVIWNRYGGSESMANAWESDGGTVVVCENGYIGSDENGIQYYAISVGGHNGSGWFPVGDEDRFAKLGIELKPWRTEGSHIVVRGQRGIGTKEMASPSNWHHLMAKRLRKLTDREVRVVEHPGNKRESEPVEQYLADAWALVIWASSVGVKALTLGVPVFYLAPHWICSQAAIRDVEYIDRPGPVTSDDDRREAMRRMSFGQWSVAEIASGEPFKRILESMLVPA